MKNAALSESPGVSYKRLLDLTPLPIAIHKKGILVYVNSFAADLVKAKHPSELLGQPIMKFVHPDFHQLVTERVGEIYSGKPYTELVNEKLLTLDGQTIDVEIISIRTTFEDEPAVLITIRDMTEIKKAEKKVWEINHTLQAIIRSSPLPIYVLDTSGKVLLWNTAAEKIFGWKEEEILGKTLPIPQKEKLSEFKRLMKKLLSGQSFSKDLIRQRKDGTLIDVNISATPLFDENKQITSIVAVTADISTRKEVERRKDEFLGIASHELKTPVTSIKAYGQVLQRIFEKEGNTKAVEQLSKMDAQINKLTNLIGDLLDVTKIQAGKMQFNQEYYDFNTLITEIVSELQLTTNKHTLVLELSETVRMYGDRERTGQVLTNLITNAIKYSPYADKIIIRTDQKKGKIVLSVQDFGVGIPDENKEKVFEQFYRVSGPHLETFPGLGLGLYISSEIIKRQGGKIWVESSKGKGSTFYFSLPLKAPTAKQKAPHARS